MENTIGMTEELHVQLLETKPVLAPLVVKKDSAVEIVWVDEDGNPLKRQTITYEA